jgi:cysteine synthase
MTASFGVSLQQQIGNTPLLRIERATGGLRDVQMLAKAEWTNPGGSVKDRAASNIVAEAFHGIEGTKHMGTSIIAKIYDASIADAKLGIETEAAYTMARRVAREEGLLIGVSAAAALVGAVQIAKDAADGSVVVTIFPDSGDKYLSEHFWDENP